MPNDPNNGWGLAAHFATGVAETAFEAAKKFFDIPAEWRIELLDEDLEDDSRAQCRTEERYLRAQIVYDSAQFERGAGLWSAVAHEIAHLFLADYDAAEHVAPGTLHRWLLYANERTVTRLERLFVRQTPYPGDEAFAPEQERPADEHPTSEDPAVVPVGLDERHDE